MTQDIRLAFRRLAHTPGFVTVTVATLALAIGANTTTFSALNQFLLRPLPVERPKELVFLNTQGGGISHSYLNYVDFRDRNRTLTGLAAYRIQPAGLSQGGKNSYIWGSEATGNYFDLLGVHAFLGRTLTPEDDSRQAPRAVLVISYASWQSRFAGDPNIVGKSVKLNGLDYSIVGVAPKSFFGTEVLLAPEFWVPMSMEPQLEPGNNWLDNRGTWNIWVIGRLKPGITVKQAESDLNSIAGTLAQYSKLNEGLHIILSPPGLVGSVMRGPVIGFAGVLMALAGMVLLIACVNIAGILLARAAERRREISIRLAIGAPRWKLVRQLLTESLLLSSAGAVAGILLAAWLLRLIAAFRASINVPISTGLPLDARVLAFSVSLCFLTTMLFGLAPAIQAARVDLLAALKNQVSDRFRRVQVRDLLVGAQVTLSLVLLVGTVLVVRSLQRAVTIDIGFNPHHAVAVMFDVALNGYNDERGKNFERQLMDQLKTVAGLEAVGLTNYIPLGVGQSSTTVYAEGKTITPANRVHPFYYAVSSGYFHAMQTRMLAGRDFNESDRAGGQRVAIVNQALGHALYPDGSALGKRFQHGGALVQIVGIVQDGKYQSMNDVNEPALFWPRSQRYDSTMAIVARSSMPEADVLRRVQQAISSIDPEMPLFEATSLEEHLNLPLFPARIAAMMLGGFGVLAVVLAATGLYGMLAYAISRRTREIGIRVAIGASRTNVLSLVLRRAMIVVASASALGAVLALAAGRLFSPILYGVSPRDPATYVAALVLMAAVALVAAYVPARRALGIEAAVALRDE